MEANVTEILDRISDALYTVDEHWSITYVNQRVTELWGKHPQELVGKPLWEEFPLAGGTSAYDKLLSAMRERRAVEFEYETPAVDRWLHVRAYPSGAGLLLYCNDITERKHVELDLHPRLAEAEATLDAIRQGAVDAFVISGPDGEHIFTLKGADEPYRLMVEQMQEGALTLTPEGLILYCNRRFADMLKITLQEVIGGSVFRFVTPAGRAALADFLRQAAHTPSQGEVTLRAADGAEAPVYLVLNTLLLDGFHPICAVVADLSEHKRLLTELDASRHLFERIAETSPNALFVYDFDRGHHLYVSARYEQILGYTADEVKALERHFATTLWHPDDLANLPAHLHDLRTLADGEIYESEYRLLQPDGTYRWLHSRTSVFARAADGRVQQIVGVTQNITERKRAEEALRRAHEELEAKVAERTSELADANEQLLAEIAERKQAEQARQHLLGQLVTAQEEERRRIAHELHDSLGQYLSALDVGLKAVQGLDGCSGTVTARIDQLRALTLRIDEEMERLTFELRPPALDDLGLADALRRHVQQWSATSGIAVDFHTRGLEQERLPPLVETTAYRIVQEALTNVLKHADATCVSLILERRHDEVLTIIEDDGCGFDLEAVQHTSRRFGLTGMVERAALAGGRLEIETEPGAGTTIYVHLPLAQRI